MGRGLYTLHYDDGGKDAANGNDLTLAFAGNGVFYVIYYGWETYWSNGRATVTDRCADLRTAWNAFTEQHKMLRWRRWFDYGSTFKRVAENLRDNSFNDWTADDCRIYEDAILRGGYNDAIEIQAVNADDAEEASEPAPAMNDLPQPILDTLTTLLRKTREEIDVYNVDIDSLETRIAELNTQLEGVLAKLEERQKTVDSCTKILYAQPKKTHLLNAPEDRLERPYSLGDISRATGWSDSHICLRLKAGDISGRKIDGRWRFTKEEYLKAIEVLGVKER